MVWNGKRYIEKVPKTASSDRYIPIPEELAAVIREQGCATTMTPHQLTQAFRKLVRRKSLGLKPFRFHDLRHAFVSIAHANGIPDAYLQKMGGWSTPRTLERVYRHSLDSYMAEYNDKMESVLRGVLRTPEK
jgi:integrase